MLQGQILYARQYAISFLSGTKNGKNGLGAMTSGRQNSRYRMKKKKKLLCFFFFSYMLEYLFFFLQSLKALLNIMLQQSFQLTFTVKNVNNEK